MPALLVAVLVLAADQLTKAAVRRAMTPGASVPVVGGVFHLTYVKNTGAAFGMLPQHRGLFVAATLVVVVLILWLLVAGRPQSTLLRVALGLQLGGALGNLADRLIAGRVTDFLDFRIWPVFNLADTALVVGAALFVIATFFSPTARRASSGDGAA